MNLTVRSSVSLLSLFLAIGLSAPSVSVAQPLDPIEELIFFGQNDHLIIDRGGPVDGLGDVNGDGLVDVAVGSGIGAIRVIYGPTNGNNGTLNGQQLDGNSGFTILHDEINIAHVAGAGDVNNDGLNDIILGTQAGTHIVFGRSGTVDRFFDVTELNGSNGFKFASGTTFVSPAGDINADGIDDLLVGNAHASINGLSGVGVTYVIYGRNTPFPAQLNPLSLNGSNGFAVIGTNTEDRSGMFVGDAGDFNNDGIDDFMIGAPNKTQGTKAEVGEAYVIYGRSAGFPRAISLYDIDGNNGLVFKGSNIQDAAGSSVIGIGDLNHDGISDIAIGAPGKGPFGSPSDYPGETYILFGGKFNGAAVLNEDSLDGNNGFVARGIRGGIVPIEEGEAIWGDLSGTSVDGAGDFNDDGIDDLLIGASHTIINPFRKGVGQIYVIYGTTTPFPSRFNLVDLDGDNGFRINGIGTVDYFGVYVRKAGDFNDDGRDDIIVGASGQGASYVIYGRDPWAARKDPAPNPINSGTPSNGFLATAFNFGSDAFWDGFNEMKDPTGPEPYPVGTPTLLGDPATPGDIPANILDPVEPLRPGLNEPEPEPEQPTIGNTDVGTTDAGGSDAGNTDGGNTDDGTTDGQGSDMDSDTGGNNAMIRTGSGAAFLLPCLVAFLLSLRLMMLVLARRGGIRCS
jgi:hypothetical protein